MEDNMKNKCASCEYFGYDRLGRANVCVNGDSPNVADFVAEDDTCSFYSETCKPCSRLVDYDFLIGRIEEQMNGIRKNPECYEDPETILEEYELVKQFIRDLSWIDNTAYNS